MEIGVCQNILKQLAQVFLLNFPYRFVGKYMESDSVSYFICYFGPITTLAICSREPLQCRETSRVRMWC